MSYLFVSHDLTVVRHMSDRIVVLFHGRVMETGDAAAIHDWPAHPYTQALLSASPIPDPVQQRNQRERISLALAPARPQATTKYCPFAARCPFATDICERVEPPLEPSPSGTLVACHHADEVAVASFSTPNASTTQGVS
jgi:peptide/nickel transport system ATP-binding protein